MDNIQRLEQQADEIFQNIAGWENSTLQRIGKRINKYSKLSLADVKAINNIAVVKQDMESITKELARVTGLNISQVEQIYAELIEQQHLANQPLYDYRGKTFVPFAENRELQAIARAYARTTGETMINLAKISAMNLGTVDKKGNFVPLQKFYTDSLDKAVMQITTGATDFHTAMRDTIQALGGSGMRVNYGSGITRRLDTAVRQSLLWGAKQASVEYNEMIGEELGCDGIEIDWHSFPRPKHEFMQGKQFVLGKARMINGIFFESADEALERLKDPGCLHFETPIICGVSEPRYSPEELKRLNEQNARRYTIDGKEYSGYEVTQMQRRLESAVREQKTIRDTAKASGDNLLVRRCNERIKVYQDKYNQISEITGIPKDTKRMSVPRTINNSKSFSTSNLTQNFKMVEKDETKTLNINRGNIEIKSTKLSNTNNTIYLSEKASLKPKQQHVLDKNITDAKRIMGIFNEENQPNIIIVNSSEMLSGVVASYNPVDNVLRVVSDLGVNEKIPILQQDGVLPNNMLSTYVHELYHWKDAQEYIQKFGKITRSNYNDYLNYLNAKSKKHIDKLISNGYNVSDMSKYSKKQLARLNYDEVYTEYRTLKILEGK